MSKQHVPIKKNDEIDVIFEDLTHDGKGVAKVDGYPLFVAGVLPGEKAKIKVTKLNKGYGFGSLVELYEKASSESSRTARFCRVWRLPIAAHQL